MTTDTIDSVLIPTDGSDGALVGANRGIELATAVGASVHVLTVVDVTEFEEVPETTREDTEWTLEAGAEAAVETVERLAREANPDLAVTTAIKRGTPHRVVEEYASSADIDLIAMGTRGRTGLERVLLGSVTENVLRTVAVPVLAVPPEADDATLTPDGVENVLFPTDGSEPAAAAVDWGIGVASVLDARVHSLYSVDTSRFAGATDPKGVLTELERTGQDALEAVRERAREAGLSVTGTVASGPAVRVILDYVDEHDVDFVVMGTHGRSGVERQLLGSVTENVVRNAAVPVVCVPIDEA